MIINLLDLHRAISEKKIIIYGAGKCARKVYPYLIMMKLRQNIISFAVTQAPHEDLFDEIPINIITDIQCNKDETIVILAVNEKNAEEIIPVVKKMGYKNILNFSDYLLSDHYLPMEFKNRSFEFWLNRMSEWMLIFEENKSLEKKNEIKNNIFSLSKNREKRNKHQIVLILCFIYPRHIKIIKALMKKGYEIIILCCKGDVLDFYQIHMKELLNLNLDFTFCNCLEELLIEVLKYRPLLYYVISGWGGCQWTEVLLLQKKFLGKIVIELYDIVSYSFKNLELSRYENEKFLLENADGIVWRWYMKEYLENKGFQIQGKSVQFMDFCSGKDELPLLHKSEDNNYMVKICYISGCYGDAFQDVDSCGFEINASLPTILKKLGNREDCLIHAYIGNKDINASKQAKKLENKYKNFRVFFEIPHEELINTIRDYDYGACLYTSGNPLPDDCTVDNVSNTCYMQSSTRDITGTTHRLSMVHRYFDFLDAGLPVITTHPKKLCEILSNYEVIINMDTDNIDIDKLRGYKNYYKKRVWEARERLSIDENIHILTKFFDNL